MAALSLWELTQRAAGATPVDRASIPAHLFCNACSKPLFNSFQTPHGCRLCQHCVSKLPQSERRRCPGNTEACRDEEEEIDVSQATCFADMATRREVAKLQVLCPNSDAGCSTKLRWGQVDSHLESCDFQSLNCQLCNEQVLKKKMQHHMNTECEQRKVKCEQCSKQVAFSEMKSKHRNLESDDCCISFSAHCPHCGDQRKKLSRREYVLHLSECPESPVECKYCHLGCRIRPSRSGLQQHYDSSMDHHLELIDSRLRQSASSHQTVAVSTASNNRELAQVSSKVDCLQQYFKKMQINVANWAHTMLEFEQMAERYGGIQQLRASLQSMDDRLKRLERQRTLDRRGTASDPSAVSTATSPQMLRLAEDFESRLACIENTSYDGFITWKIRNLARKAQEARSGSGPALSQTFFLRRFGYKFRVQLYMDGNESGQGSHLSVYVVNVPHDFDELQDWPLVADVTFRLISLADRRHDVVKSVRMDTSGLSRPRADEDYSVCCGEPRLIGQAEFNSTNSRYVKQDCCYLEVKIAELRPDTSQHRRQATGARRN